MLKEIISRVFGNEDTIYEIESETQVVEQKYEITSYIWSNPEDVLQAREWLEGNRSIPDLELHSKEVLGDIEPCDINGW